MPEEPSVPSDQIVVSDLEGTLSSGYTWKGMRDWLRLNGRGDGYQRLVLRRLPVLIGYRLKLVDAPKFKVQWFVDMLSLFKGLSTDEFDSMAQWVAEHELWQNRRQAVLAELHAHQQAGRTVLLVSGVGDRILQAVARTFGFEGIGTPLRFEQGVFAGELAGPFNAGEYKVQRVRDRIGSAPIAYAYGDTANDIAMMSVSQQAVAVHPDRGLRRAAAEQNWRILE
ncbi:MAG: HAD family hydrolase [Anaerolineales bacterium]